MAPTSDDLGLGTRVLAASQIIITYLVVVSIATGVGCSLAGLNFGCRNIDIKMPPGLYRPSRLQKVQHQALGVIDIIPAMAAANAIERGLSSVDFGYYGTIGNLVKVSFPLQKLLDWSSGRSEK